MLIVSHNLLTVFRVQNGTSKYGNMHFSKSKISKKNRGKFGIKNEMVLTVADGVCNICRVQGVLLNVEIYPKIGIQL